MDDSLDELMPGIFNIEQNFGGFHPLILQLGKKQYAIRNLIDVNTKHGIEET